MNADRAATGARERLNSLQFGRGLAALAVVIFHMNYWLTGHTGYDITRGLAQFGSRGVDFFFVLSGFIIIYIHAADVGRPARWTAFARKRFNRVYPIYWIYTAVVVAILFARHRDLLPQEVATWLSMMTLVRVNDAILPIQPAWTLFHEVAFYALFSLLIVSRRVGTVALGLWFAASLAALALTDNQAGTWLSVIMSGYNLCFLLGIAAWHCAGRLATAPTSVLAGIFLTGIAVLIATGVLLPTISPAYGLGFALIIAATVAFERRRALHAPFLTLLGDASYSLYLTHITVLSAAANVAEAFGIKSAALLSVFLLCSAVAGGILAYLLVERPMMRVLSGRSLFSFDKALWYSAAMSVLRLIICVLGKHERSRDHVRDTGGRLESACRHCGTPMEKVSLNWRVKR